MSLSPLRAEAALEYNKKHWEQFFDVKTIQEVIGAAVDGLWGPKTVDAIYEWQKLRCLEPDGKVGPNTWRAITSERGTMEDDTTDPDIPSALNHRPVHGLWLDSPKAAKNPDTWKEMNDHGITSVALMVEGHNEKFNPWYDAKALAKICRWAGDLGMDVGITDWPYPNFTWMDDMFETFRPWFDPNQHGLPLAFYESDVEGNWRPNQVRDFPNIDKAGDRLVQYKKAVVSGSRARTECTTFTAHTENGRAADVAPHMDRIFAQAYSVRGRKKKNPQTGKDESWKIPWDHTYGPGNMVTKTLDRSMQVHGVPGRVELGCGLAAYDQKWPGHSEVEAMRVSYDRALVYRVKEIRWWSWKWLFGHVATSYGKKFLLSVM